MAKVESDPQRCGSQIRQPPPDGGSQTTAGVNQQQWSPWIPGSAGFQANGLQLPHHCINIKGTLPLTNNFLSLFLHHRGILL